MVGIHIESSLLDTAFGPLRRDNQRKRACNSVPWSGLSETIGKFHACTECRISRVVTSTWMESLLTDVISIHIVELPRGAPWFLVRIPIERSFVQEPSCSEPIIIEGHLVAVDISCIFRWRHGKVTVTSCSAEFEDDNQQELHERHGLI
jgi:hypothetical protein